MNRFAHSPNSAVSSIQRQARSSAHPISVRMPNAQLERQQIERLADISCRHADALCRLNAVEADAHRKRQLLIWVAGISTEAEAQLRALLREEDAQSNLAHRDQNPAHLSEWQEIDHPRQPKGPGGGQWVAKGNNRKAATGRTERIEAAREIDRDGVGQPIPVMLELAHVWWQTDMALRLARRDVKELPTRIARERAQFGSGGRYAYIHPQNLAKLQQELETAKALVPQLQQQLRDLEDLYHMAGFDDVPFSTWSPEDRPISGKGIKHVGVAVAMSGPPASLRPTGIEFDAVSVAFAGPAILRLGRGILGRALATAATRISKPGIPQLVRFVAGGKTTGVLRIAGREISLTSGRAGPAASLPKGTPGFNAITATHVEGHAAAIMRQEGLREATVYINNPQICLPCRQNLAHMLPAGSKLTVVLPDGTAHVFIGNAR
jgi:hypothetical protein